MTELAGTARTCIYCKRARPFTDEHLFPKGLGGDDRRFMLKNLVCGYCNTTVFSKLEASFMRASPVALARIFLQKIKGSGRNALTPRLDTTSTTVFLPGQGEVEAEMLAEGTAIALVQILFPGDGKCGFTGSDASSAREFIDALRPILGDTTTIVRKVVSSTDTIYAVTSYVWQGAHYVDDGSHTAARPPKACIWHESFPTVGEDRKAQRHPTLYRRTAGQFALRAHPHSDICDLLSQARAALDALEDVHIADSDTEAVENPSMLFSLSIDMDAYGRVLTKIGLNLVAHSFGDDYIRHTAFDTAKAAVLGTAPDGVQYVAAEENDPLRNSFDGVPHDQHAMTLVIAPTSQDTCNVAMILRLYGSITYAVHLGTNAPPPPTSMPEFFIIDYNSHRIEQLNAIEFIQKYPPKRVAR